MRVVVLDGYTVNPGDLTWDPLMKWGEVKVYDRTQPSEFDDRAARADVLVVNKYRLDRDSIDRVSTLKAVCLLATGYDNVDIKAAEERGIAVFNAVGYGSDSVAQHTLALMLALTNRVGTYARSVRAGDWSAQDDFTYALHSVTELRDKTLGIIGYGMIGSRVGALAQAFGMHLQALRRSSKSDGDVKRVDREELFATSDFVTLHTPLTDRTRGMINRSALDLMKPTAYVINTGRGALINEADLVSALSAGQIAGAALDVLSLEPPRDRNPLIHAPNVIITPHMAWSSVEARKTLIQMVADNIGSFTRGDTQHRVV